MLKKYASVFREETSYKPFLWSLVITGLNYGLYKGMTDNYLAEVVKMSQLDRGVAEFFRELPGLLLVLVLAALFMFSAERLYKIGAMIMVLGMGFLSFLPPTKALVILGMFAYSFGEHIQLGMRNTMALEYSRSEESGAALGHMNALVQIGTLAGFAVITAAFLIFKNKPYKPFLVLALIVMIIACIYTFRIKGNSRTDATASRFYFRKKFTKYYMLEVFYGARKQVFFTFGPYVLILFYGAGASVIAFLFAVSAIAGYLLAPLVGKIIDKVGYKKVMVADTLLLVIVCFFYGFAHHLFPERAAFIVCCANYVLDSVISLAAMASNVYVQDLSDSPEEMRATISTGISVNHLITIFIALFGGWIWQKLGIETLFMISAFLGLCNSAYAASIKNGSKGQRE